MKEKDLPVARKRELFAAAFGPRLLDDGFFPVKRALRRAAFTAGSSRGWALCAWPSNR